MARGLQLTVFALTLLLTTSQAWPTYHFSKRQSPGDSPPAQSEDPTFEEEYDFIIAGGMKPLPLNDPS